MHTHMNITRGERMPLFVDAKVGNGLARRSTIKSGPGKVVE
jgi:hypothetical protein